MRSSNRREPKIFAVPYHHSSSLLVVDNKEVTTSGCFSFPRRSPAVLEADLGNCDTRSIEFVRQVKRRLDRISIRVSDLVVTVRSSSTSAYKNVGKPPGAKKYF